MSSVLDINLSVTMALSKIQYLLNWLFTVLDSYDVTKC